MPRGLAPHRNNRQIQRKTATDVGTTAKECPQKMPPSEIGLTVEPVRIHSQPTP
jgi:hypothetical protein